MLRKGCPKIKYVHIFQIGLDPLPPPHLKCTRLENNFRFFLSIHKKINLFKCKLWGEPPPLLEKAYILNFFAPFPKLVSHAFPPDLQNIMI